MTATLIRNWTILPIPGVSPESVCTGLTATFPCLLGNVFGIDPKTPEGHCAQAMDREIVTSEIVEITYGGLVRTKSGSVYQLVGEARPSFQVHAESFGIVLKGFPDSFYIAAYLFEGYLSKYNGSMNLEQLRQLGALIRDGKKIQAIKAVKKVFPLGLMEAKKLVEEFMPHTKPLVRGVLSEKKMDQHADEIDDYLTGHGDYPSQPTFSDEEMERHSEETNDHLKD